MRQGLPSAPTSPTRIAEFVCQISLVSKSACPSGCPRSIFQETIELDLCQLYPHTFLVCEKKCEREREEGERKRVRERHKRKRTCASERTHTICLSLSFSLSLFLTQTHTSHPKTLVLFERLIAFLLLTFSQHTNRRQGPLFRRNGYTNFQNSMSKDTYYVKSVTTSMYTI
jgi:hypothetical protein